jgi:hypothetical protein
VICVHMWILNASPLIVCIRSIYWSCILVINNVSYPKEKYKSQLFFHQVHHRHQKLWKRIKSLTFWKKMHAVNASLILIISFVMNGSEYLINKIPSHL